jgi:hypothetical protein
MIIEIPELERKIHLLYGNVLWKRKDGSLDQIWFQKDVAEALGMNRADFNRALHGIHPYDHPNQPYLPEGKVKGLLGLFDVSCDGRDDTELFDIVGAPFNRFREEVKRAGGKDYVSGQWDGLVAAKSSPVNQASFAALSLERKGTASTLRLLFESEPNPYEDAGLGLDTFHVGDHVRIRVDFGPALGSEFSTTDAYLFILQDYRPERENTRRFRAVAINHRYNGEGTFPSENKGKPKYLIVPANWGARRTLIALVTERCLHASDVGTEPGAELSQGMLDGLAENLQRKHYGKYYVWLYDYYVEDAR